MSPCPPVRQFTCLTGNSGLCQPKAIAIRIYMYGILHPGSPPDLPNCAARFEGDLNGNGGSIIKLIAFFTLPAQGFLKTHDPVIPHEPKKIKNEKWKNKHGTEKENSTSTTEQLLHNALALANKNLRLPAFALRPTMHNRFSVRRYTIAGVELWVHVDLSHTIHGFIALQVSWSFVSIR